MTGKLLADFGLALDPDGWRERLAPLEAAGVTEIGYQPAGPLSIAGADGTTGAGAGPGRPVRTRRSTAG